MEKLNLTKQQEDSIREMANIGSGNASTALSKIASFVGGPKQQVVGVYAPISRGVIGNIIMIFPIKDVLTLMDFIEKKEPGFTTNLTNAHKQKIIEIGDITSISYLDAVNKLLNMNIKKGKSKIVSTFGESISDFVLIGVGKEKYALVLRAKTGFDLPNLNIQGEFMLVLSIKEIDKLSQKLSKKEAGETK